MSRAAKIQLQQADLSKYRFQFSMKYFGADPPARRHLELRPSPDPGCDWMDVAMQNINYNRAPFANDFKADGRE